MCGGGGGAFLFVLLLLFFCLYIYIYVKSIDIIFKILNNTNKHKISG